MVLANNLKSGVVGSTRFPGILLSAIYLFLILHTLFLNYSLQLFIPTITSASIFLIFLVATDYLKNPDIKNTLGFILFTAGLLGSYLGILSINIISAFFIAGVLILLWSVTSIRPKQAIRVSTSSFNNMRKNIENIINQIEATTQNNQQTNLVDAVSNLQNLKLDIEDYGAENWQRERELATDYHRITNNLFFICDLLENQLESDKKTDETLWFHSSIKQIFDDEKIMEIPVKKGDPFNGDYHKSVENVFDEAPKDTILEVIRKGYYKKEQVKNVITLRYVEVIVSKGPR
jgi:molecular chaperone GrpE (heat shock protein)